MGLSWLFHAVPWGARTADPAVWAVGGLSVPGYAGVAGLVRVPIPLKDSGIAGGLAPPLKHMEVSWNGGNPKSSIPHLWKPPCLGTLWILEGMIDDIIRHHSFRNLWELTNDCRSSATAKDSPHTAIVHCPKNIWAARSHFGFWGHPRVYMFITDVFWIMLTSLMSFGWGSPWVTLKCTSFGWWHWWPTPGRSDFRGEMASSLDIAAQLNKMLQVGPAHEMSFLF